MPIRRQGYGLRSAVILVVLVPLLSVLGAGGFLVLTTLERLLEARLQEDVELIARTLSEPLAQSLRNERQDSLHRALRSAPDLGRDYRVYLYDADGTLIARDDQRSVGDAPTLVDLNVRQEETTAEYGSMDGREVYSYFTPLTYAGNAIGMLQVTRRASNIRDYLDTLRANVVLVTFGFCVLFVTIILTGYHFAIGRPLGRLADTMNEVAGGDGGARAPAEGPREIRWLALRFNAMLEGLAERDAVLSQERARQIRLERRLRRSEKYALAGRLAAGVAHELGAPLSVVDGHAQRLLRAARRGTSESETLHGIRKSAARMADIVRQLLAFGAGSATTRDSVPVERLVKLAVADVRTQFDAEETELTTVAGDIRSRIMGDESRLRESLVHLLRNSLDAARGDRVRVGWERADDATRIFVENSGDPIPLENRERIFEPFFTTKPPGRGSGLGLAIVKSAVADHGADITLYEPAAGGVGFRIEFPDAPCKNVDEP